MSNKLLSRRTALKGMSVAVGLPLLEAMVPLRALASAPAVKPPLRLAFLYVPGGVNLDEWTPKGEGAAYQPGYTLQALQPVRAHVLVLSGLDGRQKETGGNGHPLGCAPWLSSTPINKRDRGGYATDVSVDQLAARKIGPETRLPSLELGCDRNATQIHVSNISWRGPGSPMGKEVNPRAVFTRLFGDPGADTYQRSVLDLVREDARGLRQRLGVTDRTKLDEYLDSVRAIERRIQIAERDTGRQPPKLALPEAVPAEYLEHVRLLTDLLVLGWQTDSTRVATFMYNNESVLTTAHRCYHALTKYGSTYSAADERCRESGRSCRPRGGIAAGRHRGRLKAIPHQRPRRQHDQQQPEAKDRYDPVLISQAGAIVSSSLSS